ncbi:MAG: hypothetical protein ACE5EB_06900 [Thermodesulfobacteriota bacterium]
MTGTQTGELLLYLSLIFAGAYLLAAILARVRIPAPCPPRRPVLVVPIDSEKESS